MQLLRGHGTDRSSGASLLPPLTSSIIYLSVPLCSHLENRDIIVSTGLLRELNGTMHWPCNRDAKKNKAISVPKEDIA